VQDLAAAEKIHPSYLSRVLSLTLLTPDIVEAILDGTTDMRESPDRILFTYGKLATGLTRSGLSPTFLRHQAGPTALEMVARPLDIIGRIARYLHHQAAARPRGGKHTGTGNADVSRPLGERPQRHAHVRARAYRIGLPSARRAGAYRICFGRATRS
jgi:hypothetical protein